LKTHTLIAQSLNSIAKEFFEINIRKTYK